MKQKITPEDEYEAACRVAQAHMPGWTAQRLPEQSPVVSDAMPGAPLRSSKPVPTAILQSLL